MMTIAERMAAEQITGTVRLSGGPAPDDMLPGSHTWDVVLCNGQNGRKHRAEMYSGPAATELTVEEALDLLISEASTYLSAADFEDYCSEFDRNPDSRAEYARYEDMGERAQWLADFLGGADRLRVWVYETERM